jgi:predicted MFS family arabinose efflux permease
VRLFARLFRLVWGGDVDRALRPVLAVGLAGSIAGASAYPFLGIWAIKHLRASQVQLSFALLIGAMLAIASGYAAGHWSDKIGRRPLIIAGWAGEGLAPLGLLVAGRHVYAGLALITALPIVGSLGGAADQAMVADLVAPERQEAAYAAVRVANNLGIAIGPVIGGILLLGSHWSHLWIGTLVLSSVAMSMAVKYLPRTGAYAPEGPPERGSFAVIVRDRPFLVFMASSVFATMTYIAFEALLPISATTTHHLAPAYWGMVMILNPIIVTLLQLRVTRWTASIPAAFKLGVAMPLMGVPFLLLNVDGSLIVIAVIIVVFVVGEMLWIPTSQAVVAAMAPADIRGAYMGAFGSSWGVAWMVAPFLGLQVRAHYGDATMWWCVASLGVLAGILGLLAARGHDEAAAVASPA